MKLPSFGFKTIRRYDGTLVNARGFAEVESTSLRDNSPDVWRSKGKMATEIDVHSRQGGRSSSGDLADTSGYGRAWWDDSLDIPRHVSAGRSFVKSTDRDLQLGPEPGRISRINDMRIGGLIGPDIQNSFPTDANFGYMPHQQVGKLVQGASPALRTIADDAWLPGVFAGNPVG